jgi:NAD+ kinase
MTVDNVEHCLDQLLSDNYKIDERMMLEGDCSNDEDNCFRALNDIVVASDAAGLYVLNLTVKVNGIQLYSHNCDGLIVSTPTGSTAYNLSANGPIVDPKTEAILMTPLNPHTLTSRSIVLDPDDEISVEITPRRHTSRENATVLFDGSYPVPIEPGEKLVVKKSARKTKMIFMTKMNFLERMRNKMQEN